MLGLSCRNYLRTLDETAAGAAHRRICQSCNDYAGLCEALATRAATLPAHQRHELAAIARLEGIAPRLAATAMPEPLRQRLCAILVPPRRRLTSFLGSPVYSLAASYLIVLLMALAWGNPYVRFRPPLLRLQTSASALVSDGSGLASTWIERARAGLSENEERARRFGRSVTAQLRQLENTLELPTSEVGETNAD